MWIGVGQGYRAEGRQGLGYVAACQLPVMPPHHPLPAPRPGLLQMSAIGLRWSGRWAGLRGHSNALCRKLPACLLDRAPHAACYPHCCCKLQATTEVGCGIAMCRQGTVGPEYLITCRYSPPGNKGGTSEFTKNLPV